MRSSVVVLLPFVLGRSPSYVLAVLSSRTDSIVIVVVVVGARRTVVDMNKCFLAVLVGITSLVSGGVLAFLRCRNIDIYGVHKHVKFLRHL